MASVFQTELCTVLEAAFIMQKPIDGVDFCMRDFTISLDTKALESFKRKCVMQLAAWYQLTNY